MMQRFPWGEIMRLGIGRLQIPPGMFWNCTLRELVLWRGDKALARAGLDDLMKDWPDE